MNDTRETRAKPKSGSSGQATSEGHDEFEATRHAMVETQLRRRGIVDKKVLAAMDEVPRHEFVPADFRNRAYEDSPLPIGEGQTISQPYIVASMTAALHLSGSARVLEIGAGCGYQAAVLSLLAKQVYTVECRGALATATAQRLSRLGYSNVHVHCGDGTLGLQDCAPFDAILVAAAAHSVPPPLLAQLGEEGRLIIPIGDTENQELQIIERRGSAFRTRTLEGCRFVPLVGFHGWKDSPAR
ncbi:MAG: protein-L-isoaspartate(D-aspartate) O-methyltransferase [Candidatus Acidiferrales bacterium]